MTWYLKHINKIKICRIIDTGRELLRSSSPTPLFDEGLQEQVDFCHCFMSRLCALLRKVWLLLPHSLALDI